MRSRIDPRKLEYLTTFRWVSDKSQGFAQLGYTSANRDQLSALLKGQAASLLAAPHTVMVGPYGTKREIASIITGPNGRTGRVDSVWIAKPGRKVAELVTAWASPF